jgi:hypothetical protein
MHLELRIYYDWHILGLVSRIIGGLHVVVTWTTNQIVSAMHVAVFEYFQANYQVYDRLR